MGQLISGFAISAHARAATSRRGISEEVVERVLARPKQRNPVRRGRHVLQRRMTIEGTGFLVRIFVDVGRVPPEVVTVYRTSKIEKYWQQGGRS